MTKINSTAEFRKLWDLARADSGSQSSLVAYGELKKALEPILADGKVTRAEARFVADTMANDPYMTKPAVKEAVAFLATVGKGKPLDAATRSAVMAEFALRAAKPFALLDVPGRLVKNTVDLPDSVQKAIADTNEGEDLGDWEEVSVRKATLAGQPVFIVTYDVLNGEMDYQKVRLFSATGQQIAEGAIDDPMAGFAWR
jgi:hypothetical protein